MSDSYTVALERALLGSCMLHPHGFAHVHGVRTADFTDPRHAALYAAGHDLAEAGRDSTAGLVVLELERLDRLSEAGGLDYVGGLITGMSTLPAEVPALAAELAQLAARRRTAAALSALGPQLADPKRELGPTLEALRAALTEAAVAQPRDPFPLVGELADELIAEFMHPEADPALPTGIGPLDEALRGGLRPSQLVLLAAPPGMGKSALASQIALGAAAVAERHPDRFGEIVLASYEMSRHEIALRLVGQLADVRDGYHPPRGWTARDLPLGIDAVRRMAQLPLRVRDDLPRTVEALREGLQQHIASRGTPALVIADHVHLLTAPTASGQLEMLTHVTGALKALAMDLGVPVLALAQMNRNVARREDHVPVLSDLRASGSLEQDADIVLFLHRPSYYLEPSERAEAEADAVPAELIVAKHRGGTTASVPVQWLARRTLFLVDPAWQPRYGASPFHVPSLITPPSGGLEDRLLEIVRERVSATGRRAERRAFFDGLCVQPRKWQDWPMGQRVDGLVVAGRLAAAQAGVGRTAPWEYWIPGDDPGPTVSPSLHVIDGAVSTTETADFDPRDELFA